MFIVCNKDKITSYVVSVFTVLVLLGIAFYMKNESDLLEASSNNSTQPIYNLTLEKNE